MREAWREALLPVLSLAPALSLAAAAVGASGCDTTCKGSGCEEQFSGSLISVLPGANQPSSGEASPLNSAFTIASGKDQGPEADIALLTGSALVGTAGDDSVRLYALVESGVFAPDDGAVVLTGQSSGAAFGATLAVLADQDGGGLAELAVGATRADGGAEVTDAGAVYVYSDMGASPTDGAGALALTVLGEGSGARLGSEIQGCGDVDGDGFGDWAAGAPWYSGAGGSFQGLVFLGASGMGLAEGAEVGFTEAGVSWTGESTGDRAGDSIACAFDLLGAESDAPDGYADLVVGAPFSDGAQGEAAGRVYVIPGGPHLDALGIEGGLADASTLTLEGVTSNAWMGWSVTTGDMNGDGQADLAAGAPGVPATNGGEARGQVPVWDGLDLRGGTRARVRGSQEGDAFGRAVQIADTNGDGLGELLVGAPHRDPTGDDADAHEAGTLYFFFCPDDWEGWTQSMSTSDARLRLDAREPYLRTGQRIRVGDIDADGLADVALVQRYDPDGGVPE